jgi:diguanylate cyclase (GGDEF)-like protein
VLKQTKGQPIVVGTPGEIARQGIPIKLSRVVANLRWTPIRHLHGAGLRLCAAMLCLGAGLLSLPGHALEPDPLDNDLVTDSWGVEQGLPQISVLAITQDRAGYLWFGTQGGLARFDGTRFTRYTQHDASELATHVQALQPDAEGRLWIGTTHGLLVLEHGRFERVAVAPRPGSRVAARFPIADLALVQDRLLVAGPEGVYTPKDGRLVLAHPLPRPALRLLPRSDGLWVGSEGQVMRIREGTVLTMPLPAPAQTSPVTALAEHGGRLWAGTRQGLYSLRDGQWRAENSGEPGQVMQMLADRDGNLWVARSQHLERLRPGASGLEPVRGEAGERAIRSFFQDRDGSLWLGGMTDGVSRVWSGWARRLGTAQGLQTPLLWSVAQAPDGRIWFGTADGVEVWDGSRFTRLLAGSRLPHPEAYSLLVEQDQAWIGTRAGVARVSGSQVEVPALLEPMRDAQVNGIVRDRQQRLWFATTSGLYMLPPDGSSLEYFGLAEGLLDPRVRVIHQTRDGRMLVGTFSGLYEWRAGQIFALGQDTGLDDPSMVSAILELDDGRWVTSGTGGEDLRVFDGQRWHRLGRERGVPANVAFFLAQDGQTLWVAGVHGVYRMPLAELDRALASPDYSPSTEIVINSGFAQPGGQAGKCCNGAGNSRGLLHDRRLWLPTREGALQVDTRPLRVRASHSSIQVDRVQALGQWLLPDPDQTLELPTAARDLKFEFSVPAFQPMRVPRLRYRLDGYEQDWRDLDDNGLRMATYTNLAPGRYVFEVADFEQGKPLPGNAQLALEIPPRLYETLAFKVLCLLLAAALPYLVYLLLQHRYARQRARLERLVQERTRDLQAANARLQAISFTDPLTGLHNRRYLARQFPDDLSFYEREAGFKSGEEAAVFVLLDIDHFKSVNDTYGHAAGDRVLEQLGQVLLELVRKGDYVVRWGGEEFLLVLRPLPRGRLADIGQRLCSEVAARDFALGNGSRIRLTVSVGLIECPVFPQSPRLLRWEQLVTLADRALYRAKHAGRDGWVALLPPAGTQPPAGMLAFEGDPWWLVEAGLLEMIGPAGGIDPV